MIVKTFRRYLLSYIGLLLVPMIILSAVVLDIVLDYCSRELVARNTLLLEQLGSAVSLELDQIDSYALETRQQSIFYSRNQEKVGAIFDVQRQLSSWTSACTIVEQIDYVNSKRGKYYTISSVNDFDNYYTLCFSDDQAAKSRLSDAVFQQRGHRWLALPAKTGQLEKLVYLFSARVAADEYNTLICTINTDLLAQMIDDILTYEKYMMFIVDAQDAVLYTNNKELRSSPEMISFLEPEKVSGQLEVDGVQYTYSRVEGGHGLTYLSAIPTEVINQPLYALWSVFYWALALIALLGVAGIYLLMKRNWLPIKQLHDTVVGDNAANGHDEVQVVRQAIIGLQEKTKQITQANQLYAQDQLIYRLLLGGFGSVDDFNKAAKACSVELVGESWKIVLVRFNGDEDTGRTDRSELLRNALPDVLMLEVPEKSSLIAIVPVHKEDEAERMFKTILSCDAGVIVSKPCHSVRGIVKAWQTTLTQLGRQNDDNTRHYDPSSASGLHDALNLGDAEKALFSFNMFLTECGSQDNLRPAAYDVLHLFQSKLTVLKRFDEAEQIRQMGLTIMQLSESEREQTGALLQQAMELVYQQLVKDDPQDAMIHQINTYLENQFSNSELTIGMVADRFAISGSNLSHYYKSRTGASVSEKLQEIRRAAAVRLLTTTDMSVAAIATQCGYAQPATFMRVFKKLMGETPSEYRNNHATSGN